MIKRITFGICILWTIAVIVGLVYLTKYTKPLSKTDIDTFCSVIFGVDTQGQKKEPAWGYSHVVSIDDVIIYEIDGYHGNWLYTIDRESVDRILPAIISYLQEQLDENDPNNVFTIGYSNWKANQDIEEPDQLKTLTNEIYKEIKKQAVRSEYYEPSDIYGRIGVAEYDNHIIIQKTKHLWANYTFEFLFLSGAIWFTCWPLIKGLKFWHFAVRISFLPLLLVTPYYLGYCVDGDRNHYSSNGILQPLILHAFENDYLRPGALDQYILTRIPRILEPLNQNSGLPIDNETLFSKYDGEYMFFYTCGPIALFVIGTVLTSILLLLHAVYKRIKDGRIKKDFANNDRIAIAKK